MRPQEAAALATTVVATPVVGLRVFTKLHVARERLSPADCKFSVPPCRCQENMPVLTVSDLNISALVAAWLFAGILFQYDDIVDELLDTPADATVDAAVYGRFDLYNAVLGISFIAALTFARLSILVFYLRLSPIRSFRYTVIGLSVFLCLYTIASVMISLLIFSPVVGGQIRNADNVLDLLYGICNSFTDLCILILPIGVVAPLQMNLRKKVAVLMLFAAGAIVCAASIWRLLSVTYISKSRTSSSAVTKQLVLSFVETNGAIICGSIPVITRFFTQFLPDVVTSYIISSKGRSSGIPSVYSTTVEKNKQRRAKKIGGGQLYSEQTSTRRIYSTNTAAVADDHDGNSLTTLERNVFGKGMADTKITADSEVFAPDQACGITRIQDTRVSYGP